MVARTHMSPVTKLALNLVFVFVFMTLGAFFYSAQTETLDNCRALYASEQSASGQGL